MLRVDSDTIKLAATVQDLAEETTLELTKPGTTGQYRLTPIDERKSNTLTQDQVNDATHAITLPNHGLVTGQAVIYHARSGSLQALTSNQTYFVFRVDANTVRLAASAAEAERGATLGVMRNVNGEFTLTARDSLVTKAFTGADVTAANAITLANHGLSTGEAVVYRAGTDTLVGQLQANTAYYVIKENDNTLKLAQSRDDAMAGVAVAITTPVGTSRHSLTRLQVVGFDHASHLQGGTEHDTMVLLGGGRLTGSWDGGEGLNSARVLLNPAAVVEGTDQRVWAVTGTDTGGLGDRQAAFLATTAVNFDQKAVPTDPMAVDAESRKEIVLRNHRLVTGQAVVYHKLTGPAGYRRAG